MSLKNISEDELIEAILKTVHDYKTAIIYDDKVGINRRKYSQKEVLEVERIMECLLINLGYNPMSGDFPLIK